jgi:voltage-gated potassium channel Kch
MKKLGFVLMLIAMSSGAFAQEYTGIWRAEADGNAFVQVTQRGQSMVIAALSADGTWEAYLGTIAGSTASVATVIGFVNTSLTVRFVSPTRAIARITSCAPSALYACRFPAGTEIAYNKIF